MVMNKIFEAALSISEPWYIKNIGFDLDKKRLDLYVDFKKVVHLKSMSPGMMDRIKYMITQIRPEGI